MTRLADIVATSQAVGANASRRAKAAAIASCLRALAPDEIGIAVAYLAGELPQRRTGIGWTAIRAARPEGAMAAPVLDLRDVACRDRRDRRRRRPGFGERASASARGAVRARHRARAGLSRPASRRRIAPGRAGRPDDRRCRRGRRHSGCGSPSRGDARRRHRQRGAARRSPKDAPGLARFAMRLFHPVAPMLAQPAEDMGAALEALGEAAVEWKVDGARVQAHKAGGEVRLYTRSLNDVTAAAPEVVEVVRASPVDELILDGEVVALHADGRPLPLPGDHVALRAHARHRRAARRPAARGVLLRLPASRNAGPHARADRGARVGARGCRCPPRSACRARSQPMQRVPRRSTTTRSRAATKA